MNNRIIIVILVIILLGIGGYLAYDKGFKSYKNNIIQSTQSQLLSQIAQVALTCQQIPIDLGNNTKVTLIAVECLQQPQQ